MTAATGDAGDDREPRAIQGTGLRILEIGDRHFFKPGLPDNTVLLWTSHRHPPDAAITDYVWFGPRAVPFLIKALSRGSFDLIVVHAPSYAPLGWRWILRLIGRQPWRFPAALMSGTAPLFLRLPTRTPIAVLDHEDPPVIERHNFWLLAKCRLYFKRELPADAWKAFHRTAHPRLPTPRLRRHPRWRRLVDKLRPISLGLTPAMTALLPPPAEKTVDLFFAGTAESISTVRDRGLVQLAQLAEAGVTVDLVTRRLPLDEYLARCARAWLTWSPEGLGWDCFRHYEAAACGSVPLINQPSILRHAPLLDGVHCLFYEIEGEGLQRTVHRALADKAGLERMAKAARAHVLQCHDRAALCRYVIDSCLRAPGTESTAALLG